MRYQRSQSAGGHEESSRNQAGACEIDNLINQGVTDFISGAARVIAKREQRRDIRLIFALPCRNQDERWSGEQKRRYRRLLAEADEVVYVPEEYFEGCMEKRNRWMVERSAYCVCALMNPMSGTGQTVRLAREQGLRVVNVGRNLKIN